MVMVVDIDITGNKKTREYVVLREMSVQEGQLVALEDLEELLTIDRKRISNTRLFLSVNTRVVQLGTEHVRIEVDLRERWYVVPVPIFKLADRNFNDWWINQERDLSRVNYGLKFNHYNFMGRAEKLALQAQFGYTRSFRIGYSLPYIDASRKTGMSMSLQYFDNNNLALETIGHKRIFLNSNEQELRRTYAANLTFSRRSSFYTTHYAGLSFVDNSFADTVIQRNPEYLPASDNKLRYLSIGYGISRDMRDNISYPLKGFVFTGSASKTGLGIFNQVNIFNIEASYTFFKPLISNLYFSNSSSTRLSTPKDQPYHLLRGLGYGLNFVRGLELYVIEGQHHLLNKSELKWQLVKHEFNLGKILPWDQFNKVPIALYPKIYFDAAYVVMQDPKPENNFLVNRPIWGTGVGLDVVSFYDFVFQLEYSMNSLLERGIFIHIDRKF